MPILPIGITPKDNGYLVRFSDDQCYFIFNYQVIMNLKARKMTASLSKDIRMDRDFFSIAHQHIFMQCLKIHSLKKYSKKITSLS